MKRTLAALAQSLADWLDPSRANIRKALRDADTMQAIQREAMANISRPRSYADECEAIRLEQEQDAELREAGGKHLTPMQRKLRVAK